MGFVKGLKCRECGKAYPKEPLHVCSFCFGPLEVDYDYNGIKKVLTRKLIESRGKTMWRYQELLPLMENRRLAHRWVLRHSLKQTISQGCWGWKNCM